MSAPLRYLRHSFSTVGYTHSRNSEIITYLYILYYAQKHPEQNVGDGMEITASDWAQAFGKKDDKIGRGYEAFRHLFQYGLSQSKEIHGVILTEPLTASGSRRDRT